MSNENNTNDVGRPTKYKPEYADLGYRYCLLGAIDKELAELFEVSESTLNLWKLEYPEFSESLKRGKARADAKVAEKLFERATGYSHEAVKIFADKDGNTFEHHYIEHYPPDTKAATYWLNNRQGDRWKEKVIQEQSGLDGNPIENTLTVKFVDVEK